MMRPVPTATATHGLPATRAPRTPRCSRTAFKFALPRASFASDVGDIADGFLAEYELAGVKLEPLAKRQLRDWYVSELQRASSAAARTGTGGQALDGSTVDAQASKTLPPLLQRRPGLPQLTVLWDLESVKPFTQQHRAGPVDLANDTQQQQHRARTGTLGGRATRLAAAGLSGAGSSPDLIGALDQLCRTLMQYGTLHAVHLFLRESTLGKAPVLRRQVEQLHTWVGLREEGDDDAAQEQSEKQKAAGVGANIHYSTAEPVANLSSATPGTSLGGGDSTAGKGLQGRASEGSKDTGARRRLSSVLPLSDDVHDCPMCRTAYPSRLDLLRHFTAAHQGPLLAATAADTRTHIMWTRGRPVGLSVAARSDRRVGTAAGLDSAPSSDTPAAKVVVSPEEFAYARELLMHGRHLDGLLAAAPVAVHSVNPGAAASPDVNRSTPVQGTPRLDSLTQAQPIDTTKAGGTVGSGGGGSGGSSAPSILSRRGLHLHLVPAGQPTEAAAESLRQVAEALAAEEASKAASLARRRGSGGARSSAQRGGGRAAEPPGRGRKGAKKGAEGQEVEDAPVACVCIVSDAEGLDQTLADLQQQDVLAMAVTRVSRVPSADVSLRWWAVQGGEYRLATVKQRSVLQ